MPMLFPYARSGFAGTPSDTWTPGLAVTAASYDHRDEEYVGALWPDYDATYGHRIYRGVKNTSASSIAAARVVSTEAGETNMDHVEICGANAVRPRVRGVTIGAIAAGDCGWVVCYGNVGAEAVTSDVTADTTIATDASGLVKVGVYGTQDIIGSSLELIDVSVLATGTVFVNVL